MITVILQPSYIPWRGYFDLIYRADTFVFYDDVQFDRRGWRNRNKIKGRQPGGQWLTIPVHSKGAQVERTPINEIEISRDQEWARKHWETIRHVYGKSPYFDHTAKLIEPFYKEPHRLLVDVTISSTIAIARALGISHTRFVRSSELPAAGSKTDRLVSIITELGGTHYISGPSAREYIEPEKFAARGIELDYIYYDYPPYPQLAAPFDAQLSILDLLFMTGPTAGDYIWKRRGAGAAPPLDRGAEREP